MKILHLVAPLERDDTDPGRTAVAARTIRESADRATAEVEIRALTTAAQRAHGEIALHAVATSDEPSVRLSALVEAVTDVPDLVVITDPGTAVQPYFHDAVARIHAQGVESFGIRSRVIEANVEPEEDLTLLYAGIGTQDAATSCLILPGAVLPTMVVGDTPAGDLWAARLLRWNLASLTRGFHTFEEAHLTFRYAAPVTTRAAGRGPAIAALLELDATHGPILANPQVAADLAHDLGGELPDGLRSGDDVVVDVEQLIADLVNLLEFARTELLAGTADHSVEEALLVAAQQLGEGSFPHLLLTIHQHRDELAADYDALLQELRGQDFDALIRDQLGIEPAAPNAA